VGSKVQPTIVPKVDVVDANSFCTAPWFVVRTQWDGEYRPCCELKPEDTEYPNREIMYNHTDSLSAWQHSGYMQHLRQQFLQGKKPPECRSCWSREQSGLLSQRQILNENLTGSSDVSSTWAKSYIRHRSDQPAVMMADVKVSHVCNYGCVMCSPADSSVLHQRWTADQSLAPVKQALSKDSKFLLRVESVNQEEKCYNWLDTVLEQPLRVVKFLGGEPLLDKRALRRLRDLSKERATGIKLNFVTNGSQEIVTLAKELGSKFAQVNFVISLEGTGSIQEWARQGSDWSVVEQNILAAKAQGIGVQIHHTLQAATVLRLDQLLTWCDANQLVCTFGELEQPAHLALSVLDQSLFEQAVKKLAPWPLVRQFLHQETVDSQLVEQFRLHVAWHDQYCKDSLVRIVPELGQML
jgi:molybdenum cofactor biosynthesis enzyme MoaA